MNRSGYDLSYTGVPDVFTYWGSLQGAGNAVMTIPTTTMSTTSSIQPMSATNNWVQSCPTHAGTGQYTILLKEGLPTILDITVNVWGTNGKYATIVDYNPSTRTLSILTFAANGTAADLATTDNLKVTIVGQTGSNLGA